MRGLDDDGKRTLTLERVETLVTWARDRERFTLGEDVTSTHLLCVAADFLEGIGELDEALDLATEASIARDGRVFEAHPVLITIHLSAGRVDEALRLADEVRAALRSMPDIVDDMLVERIADLLEFADAPESDRARLLAAAERWYTIGARRATVFADDGRAWAIFLSGRFRVRRLQGKREDVQDAETRELRRELGWTSLDA